MSRVAVIWNPDVGGAATAWQATEDAAKRFGISLRSHETRQPEEFAPAFDSIGKEAVNAILVFSDGGDVCETSRDYRLCSAPTATDDVRLSRSA
jgi:hypothetical protein